MFAVFSALSVGLSIRETSRSRHRAIVVEIAGRQRTLAERYVRETILAKAGAQADPATTGSLLRASADSLIDGGLAPAVNGDDDETRVPAATGLERRQLIQARRLVNDLTATGSAWLANRPIDTVKLSANEKVTTDPERRLAVLAALTSNVSLNAARTIASGADKGISALILTQVLLGTAGLFAALLLALALTAATRRQTAHFRSLVSASTDLVLVFGEGGCRYASQAVAHMVGVPERELLEDGYAATIHPEDRALLAGTCIQGVPSEVVFRLRNRLGEWRHVEAHVSDLRNEQHVRGVVLNGRDISERVALEEELDAPGLPRRADRPPQPSPLPRPARPRPGTATALARSARAAAGRPRRLQADQRQLRPRRRRPVARAGRRALRGRHAADRHRRPLRRRRVRRARRGERAVRDLARHPAARAALPAGDGRRSHARVRRQHRHRHRPGRRWRGTRGADPPRRHRHVRRQEGGPRPLRGLPRRDGARVRGDARPRVRAPTRTAARRIHAPLPAGDRGRGRSDRGCRGPAALDLADARRRLSG